MKTINATVVKTTTTKENKGAWSWTKNACNTLAAKVWNAMLWLNDKIDSGFLALGMDPNNAWDTKFRKCVQYFRTYKDLPLWKKCTKFVIDSFLYISYQAYALLGSMLCFLVMFA